MSMGYGAAQQPASSSSSGGLGGFFSSIGQGLSEVGKGAENIWTNLPQYAEKSKPITEVVGSLYGIYSSYEQAKAARKAAENYGAHLSMAGYGNTITPLFIPQPQPQPSAGFAAPVTPAVQTSGNPQQLLLIGGIILAAFVFLKKK